MPFLRKTDLFAVLSLHSVAVMKGCLEFVFKHSFFSFCNGAERKKYESKTKNKKTITLAKSAKYFRQEQYSNHSYKYSYNPLFPSTHIRVTVKNKKTKEVSSYTYTLETISKK